MNTESEIRFLGDLSKVELRPTDVLVLTVDAVLSDETVSKIRETLASSFHGHKKILVMQQGMKLGVLSQIDE